MAFPKVNNEAIAFEKETKNKLKLSLLFSEHASVENVGVHTALFKGPTLRSLHSSHPASLTVPSAPCHSRLSPTLHSYPLKSQLDPFVPSHFPGCIFIHFQVLGLVRMSPILTQSPQHPSPFNSFPLARAVFPLSSSHKHSNRQSLPGPKHEPGPQCLSLNSIVGLARWLTW